MTSFAAFRTLALGDRRCERSVQRDPALRRRRRESRRRRQCPPAAEKRAPSASPGRTRALLSTTRTMPKQIAASRRTSKGNCDRSTAFRNPYRNGARRPLHRYGRVTSFQVAGTESGRTGRGRSSPFFMCSPYFCESVDGGGVVDAGGVVVAGGGAGSTGVAARLRGRLNAARSFSTCGTISSTGWLRFCAVL